MKCKDTHRAGVVAPTPERYQPQASATRRCSQEPLTWPSAVNPTVHARHRPATCDIDTRSPNATHRVATSSSPREGKQNDENSLWSYRAGHPPRFARWCTRSRAVTELCGLSSGTSTMPAATGFKSRCAGVDAVLWCVRSVRAVFALVVDSEHDDTCAENSSTVY